MISMVMRKPGADMGFYFKVVVRSGVLFQAANVDFLAMILSAKEQKQVWQRELPHSCVRVQLFYPNKSRVGRDAVEAALAALADPVVLAGVRKRVAVASAKNAAGGEAGRASARAAAGGFFAGREATVFSQAGVVAPPDSLTGETSSVSNLARFYS